jgi:hypothetical protein
MRIFLGWKLFSKYTTDPQNTHNTDHLSLYSALLKIILAVPTFADRTVDSHE